MQIDSMVTLSKIDITEDNKHDVLGGIFNFPFEELSAENRLDLICAVLSVCCIDVPANISFDALADSFNSSGLSEQAFERFICDVLILELVILAFEREVNVDDVICTTSPTVTTNIKFIKFAMETEISKDLMGVSVEPFSTLHKQAGVSLGDFNVSLVAKYIQAVLLKIYNLDESTQSDLDKVVPIYNYYVTGSPCKFLGDVKMPSTVESVDDMIKSINTTIESALELNESFVKARFDVLKIDLNEYQTDKYLSEEHYGMLCSDLKKFFTKSSKSNLSGVNALLGVFIGTILPLSDYSDFITNGLEV